MAKRKRSIRPEIIVAGIFILIIIFALIMDWWKTHAVIGWTLVGVVVVAFVYSLFRFPKFRNWVFKTGKIAGEKVLLEESEPPREQIPRRIYEMVIARARGHCENPDCKNNVKPVIHHINKNNKDNDIRNLIALCPNCHSEAHNTDKFENSQLRNFVRDNYNRQKAQKKI